MLITLERSDKLQIQGNSLALYIIAQCNVALTKIEILREVALYARTAAVVRDFLLRLCFLNVEIVLQALIFVCDSLLSIGQTAESRL